ncbi:hypothetical protein [Desulfosediminicola flagellatus]|uniref:hypothetical protein n=1 Tax=Desulfosediminicola flagellatus TaxID=2569541 RepID=UPI0010AD738E|nr:hypothetical protein [Desulfosediminicola flagellatus]
MRVRIQEKNRTLSIVYILFSIFSITALLTFLRPSSIYAAETESADQLISSQAEELNTEEENDDEELLDTTQKKASVMLLDAAEWFDHFFDDSRFTEEENQSIAKLRISTEYTEENGFDFSPSIRWRIDLPRLSNKAQLILFAKDDPEDDLGSNIQGARSNDDSFRESFAAGIQYFIKSSEKYNISTTFGGSFSYLYGGLRFRYYKDLGPWQSRFVERVRYYTDDGWENYISFDLERHISAKWLLRSSAEMYWREIENSRDHYLTFQLYQFISEYRAISYEWANTFDTEPSHKLSDLTLRLRYRQNFLRDWLIFEIAPQVNFPESHDREPQYGINFTIEAKFGNLEREKIRNIFNF